MKDGCGAGNSMDFLVKDFQSLFPRHCQTLFPLTCTGVQWAGPDQGWEWQREAEWGIHDNKAPGFQHLSANSISTLCAFSTAHWTLGTGWETLGEMEKVLLVTHSLLTTHIDITYIHHRIEQLQFSKCSSRIKQSSIWPCSYKQCRHSKEMKYLLFSVL